MRTSSRFVLVIVLAFFVLKSLDLVAQQPSSAAGVNALPLFAVQIRTGDRWDAAKPPQEQLHFRDHSANLKRLREAGNLIMGARYSDVGLIILAAESETQARAMMDEDPSFEAGIFRYEVHHFSVFYPGSLQAAPRKASGK